MSLMDRFNSLMIFCCFVFVSVDGSGKGKPLLMLFMKALLLMICYLI